MKSKYVFEPGQMAELHGLIVSSHWNGLIVRIIEGPLDVRRAAGIQSTIQSTAYSIELPDGRWVCMNASRLRPAIDTRRGRWSVIQDICGWIPATAVAASKSQDSRTLN